MKKLLFAVFILIGINSFAQKKYEFEKTIAVGGKALGWDYFAEDAVNGNIYISHGIKVLVLSEKEEKVVAEISNTIGVHGIAFDYHSNKGFISNGKSNSITIFDLKTFKTLDTLAIPGKSPDAILYDNYSKNLFVFNAKSNDFSVVNPATLKVIKNISFDGNPEFAVSDLRGTVYVNIEDKSSLVAIDAKNLKVIKEWKLYPGEEPAGLAIDIKNGLLFSGCANKTLTVFDIKKEKVIQTLPIGGKSDAVVFDAQTKLIYSSNGEGNLTIIEQQTPAIYKVIQTLTTQPRSKTMALSSSTKKIFLPAAKFGEDKKMQTGSFNILVYKPSL